MENNQDKKIAFAKPKDIIIILVAIAVLLGTYFVYRGSQQVGTVAHVTVTTKDGSQRTQTIPLSKDKLYTIDDALLTVYLQVENSRIRFVDSICPDHDCEGFGWLSHEGDWAACLPGGVTVQITEG